MNSIVAIDGPSASGKSTVSHNVAKQLGYIHVDSGAIYRALTWQIINRGLANASQEEIIRYLANIAMRFFVKDGDIRFTVNDADPGEALRSLPVQEHVSALAAIPAVRAWVGDRLRSLATSGNLVVEGRDIGTVVFPEAAFKFYLDADPEERARRRYLEQHDHPAGHVTAEEVKQALARRDTQDQNRKTAPLAQAPDARHIDTTRLPVEMVTAQILAIIKANVVPRGADAQVRNGFKPVIYHVSRLFFLCYLLVYHRYRTFHRDNVPRHGGCILASNHASFLDPIAVGCNLWQRHVCFLARDTLFKYARFLKWWAVAVGVLPIDRTRGDIRALKAAIKLVQHDDLLCLFPEGTRTRDGRLQAVKAGIGFLIEKAGVPVVPVYVSGTFQAFPRNAHWIKPHKIAVYYGRPIMPSDCAVFRDDPEKHQKIADLVMARIAALEPVNAK